MEQQTFNKKQKVEELENNKDDEFISTKNLSEIQNLKALIDTYELNRKKQIFLDAFIPHVEHNFFLCTIDILSAALAFGVFKEVYRLVEEKFRRRFEAFCGDRLKDTIVWAMKQQGHETFITGKILFFSLFYQRLEPIVPLRAKPKVSGSPTKLYECNLQNILSYRKEVDYHQGRESRDINLNILINYTENSYDHFSSFYDSYIQKLISNSSKELLYSNKIKNTFIEDDDQHEEDEKEEPGQDDKTFKDFLIRRSYLDDNDDVNLEETHPDCKRLYMNCQLPIEHHNNNEKIYETAYVLKKNTTLRKFLNGMHNSFTRNIFSYHNSRLQIDDLEGLIYRKGCYFVESKSTDTYFQDIENITHLFGFHQKFYYIETDFRNTPDERLIQDTYDWPYIRLYNCRDISNIFYRFYKRRLAEETFKNKKKE